MLLTWFACCAVQSRAISTEYDTGSLKAACGDKQPGEEDARAAMQYAFV
jgi:hypothetical protein